MRKCIHQETLKLIACVSMLLDHIGATVFPCTALRIIGRLAFPIYCFLLSEGAYHTKNPGKYALRLFAGAVLSEVPFDMLFFGSFTWQHQSVMVTLLLAFFMMLLMKRGRSLWDRVLVMLPFALGAELFCTDYGGLGVILAGLFFLTRQMPTGTAVQLAGTAVICLMLPSTAVFGIPIQLFGTAAIIPIGLYSGRKLNASQALQWGFYLFYPMHLAVLAGIIG